VAAGTELLVVVAVAAIGLSRVRRRGMPGEKSRCVIAGGIPRIRPVTVEALGSGMAAETIPRATPCHVGVLLVPVGRVSNGRVPRELSARPAARPGVEHRFREVGLAVVTGEATLARVTGLARLGRSVRRLAVSRQEIRCGMARRRFESRRNRERPRVETESLNRPSLGRVHVTGDAKVSRVTGGARRSDREAARVLRGWLRQLTVSP